MLRYAITRLGVSVLTLFSVVTAVFFLARLTGDPSSMLIPLNATPQVKQDIRHDLGLDQPLIVQYGKFLWNGAHGDFGVSYRTGEPVTTLLAQRASASGYLAGLAVLISIISAVPLGILAAVYKDRWVDGLIRGGAFLGQAVPGFFVGILFVQLVAANVSWLPAGGDDRATSVVLPAATLAIFLMAAIIRLLRASMIEALQSDYVRMARLKGLPETTVVWKHALKNALLPVLALTGMYAALGVTVVVVVEVVFAWPGVGQLTYDAILNRDLAVLQIVVIFASALTITASLLVDWLSAIIDPRIRAPLGARA